MAAQQPNQHRGRTMPAITAQQLRDIDACRAQQALFARYFGESVEVTHELALKHACEFDWDFAAMAGLLSAEGEDSYEDATWEARAECSGKIGIAWDIAAACRGMSDVLYSEARAKYAKARDKARAEFAPVAAAAFVDAYISDNT